MLGLVEVLRGMTIGRIVATTDVAALETQPQMHPFVAGLETFLAAVGRLRLDSAYLTEMLALWGHGCLLQAS